MVRDVKTTMRTTDHVIAVLVDVLQLGDHGSGLDESTRLLDALPELDSMAVATIIGVLEERFGIIVVDDELSAEIFATVGSLAAFVDQKLMT